MPVKISELEASKNSADQAETVPGDLRELTRPMGLSELPMQAQLDSCLSIIGQHHKRIAATIKSMWGNPQCSEYISNLILDGGDGFAHHWVGFSTQTVSALLRLIELYAEHFDAGGPLHRPPSVP